MLETGTKAPDFTLNSTPDQKLALSELRGQPVVLTFYPADWSPVCGDEMALFNAVLPGLQELGAAMLGMRLSRCVSLNLPHGGLGVLDVFQNGVRIGSWNPDALQD